MVWYRSQGRRLVTCDNLDVARVSISLCELLSVGFVWVVAFIRSCVCVFVRSRVDGWVVSVWMPLLGGGVVCDLTE